MRNIFRLFLLLLFLTITLDCHAEFILSNGQKAFLGNSFTLSLLGSRKATHQELRSINAQISAIKGVEKQMRAWGINMDRKVHIRFYTDTNFPARDMWLSAGIIPDKYAFDKYEEKAGLVFASMSGYEFAHLADKLNDIYFFLNPFSDQLAREYAIHPRKLSGKLLDEVISIIREERARLEKKLDKPIGQQLRDYTVFQKAGYSSDSSVIWIPVTKPDTLHRYLDTTTHEYGHHAFDLLRKQILNRVFKIRKWTNPQIIWVSDSLLAVNEFFADYVAVSNGYNTCVDLHNSGNRPKDVKRVFSQKRMLKEFAEEIKTNERSRFYLDNQHNSLNPIRSFVWLLRHEIGGNEADQIVLEGVKMAITQFFTVDLPKFKRTALPDKGWGCFVLKDYPTDIITENLRFLGFLEKAALKSLNSEQKKKFIKIAGTVFQGYYPVISDE